MSAGMWAEKLDVQKAAQMAGPSVASKVDSKAGKWADLRVATKVALMAAHSADPKGGKRAD